MVPSVNLDNRVTDEEIVSREISTWADINSKYPDTVKHESWADNSIFFRISPKLVDPLRNAGLTPNMVTVIGTLFTMSTIYFLHKERRGLAIIVYLIGYTLDCVDGRMARRYKMGSALGKTLDMVSDILSNGAIILYILLFRKMGKSKPFILLLILVLTFMLNKVTGVNEAVTLHKETGSDNFYQKHQKEIDDDMSKKPSLIKQILYPLYKQSMSSIYRSYRVSFPTYDERRINLALPGLKEFGPGNYCLVMACLLWII